MSRFFMKTINCFFYFFIALFLFVNIVKLSEYIAPTVLEPAFSLALGIAVLLLFYFGKQIFSKVKNLLVFPSHLSASKLAIILFLFVAITKVVLVFLLDTDVAAYADMPNYLIFASEFADKGVIAENTFYATRYPYTVVFGMFLTPVVKFFGNDPKVVTTFMSILYAVISVVLFDIIRKYTGNTKAFLGILVFNISPVGLFISQVLIHETALLFLYSLSVWLFLKVINNSNKTVFRVVCLVVSAMLISFGTCLNQGGIVAIIAYVITALIILFKNKINIKRVCEFFVVALCYILCFLVMSSCISGFVTNSIVYSSPEEEIYATRAVNNHLTFGWSLYLGLNPEERGQFNDVDFNTYNKYYEMTDDTQAREYQKELIGERLEYFADNPLEIPVHLYYKYKKIFARPFVAIEYCKYNNLYPVLDGKVVMVLRYIANLYNISLATIILFSFKRKTKKEKTEDNYTDILFKLFFVGLILALISFEMAQKYVSHTQIILTCIGVMGLSSFMDNSESFNLKICNKFSKLKSKKEITK